MSNAFAFTTSNSTSKTVNLVTFDKESPDAAVGKLIFFDVTINNNVYRSIGTVSKMTTENSLFSQGFEKVASRGLGSDSVQSTDVRKSTIIIQAVFKQNENGIWEQYGSALPTSPATRAKVHLLNDETIDNMLEGVSYPTVGKFRGLKTASVPLALPNYGSATGAKHLAVLGKSGSGKRLSVDTPMPTPNGWTTMGEIKDGDSIFDEQGRVCKVVKAHDIELSPQSYEVVFSDGSTIKADAEHLWYTETEASRQSASHKANIRGEGGIKLGSVKTTQEILETLTFISDEGETWNHSIPVAKALELPETALPLQPYIFGEWLCSNSKNKPSTMSKRIPTMYLRSSVAQRRELLAGIMDTDGNATKTAAVEFTSVYKDLAYDVHELTLSLGYRATFAEKDAKIGGRFVGKKYVISWSTNDDVFKLSRKVKTHREYSKNYNESKNTQRYIVAVNKIAPTEMRCITVDSPNSLYLAGRNFVPTHNTALSGMLLSAFMTHESHAIFVIDPQGQWANENGMPLSPQRIAKGLGRPVTVVRISEDVRMPMDADLFGRMMDKLELWKRFRRMGGENRDVFSREVAERIASLDYKELNHQPREVLSKVFKEIAYSPSTLSRIYAKGDRQEMFRDELFRLIGEPVINADGEMEIITDEDLKDVEKNWESILSAFTPLHSLFSNTNLNGEKRQPLGGKNGFMSNIFKVRKENPDEPAPYVIVDMSPNIKLHAKAELANTDAMLNMQKVLDNADIKALMLMIVLQEMKKASETAFATSMGGNLNTQIVFDEAWRFAPEGKASPEIEELAEMLQGFALDTRKFGIGWTYILQSPGDLKAGIWRQLTYVVAGYGLVGEDVRKLEYLTDDVEQVELYRQFISPTATGEYPFMFMGPISPLIFSTSPTFLNAFTNVEDFLDANRSWIQPILKKRSLPEITADYMVQPLEKKTSTVKKEPQEYSVGKNYDISEPQTVKKVAPKKVKPEPSNEGDVAPPPF